MPNPISTRPPASRRVRVPTLPRVLAFVMLSLSFRPAAAQDATDELVARERARAGAEAAIEEFLSPVDDGGEWVNRAMMIIDRLEELGPSVVPFLTNELDQELPMTFEFVAFALGRFCTPDVDEALKRSLERAEEDNSGFAVVRKAQVLWALGMHGHTEPLEAMVTGRHRIAGHSVHQAMSVMESVGVLSAPDSVPVLIKLLERFATTTDELPEIRWPIRALGRIRDSSAAPALLALLEHEESGVRREAVGVLGKMSSPEVVDAIVLRLSDDDPSVRRTAASSLRAIAEPRGVKFYVGLIEAQDDGRTRSDLYAALVRSSGTKGLDALRARWAKVGWDDREFMIPILGKYGGKKVVRLLAEAMAHPSTAVTMPASRALAHIGGTEARDALVGTLSTDSVPTLMAAIEALTLLDDPLAAPAIATRLQADLGGPLTDYRHRAQIQSMFDALVSLNDAQAAPRLREALKYEHARWAQDMLIENLDLLDLVAGNGDDVAKWLEMSRHTDAAIRKIAYVRLGKFASPDAERGLVAAYEGAEQDDRVAIVRALGQARLPETMELIEKILVSPSSDEFVMHNVRTMAAWTARRIGGERMTAALVQAVRRRNGRDGRILIYAALTAGPTAGTALLAEYRVEHLRYIGWKRGLVDGRLVWLERELPSGRPLDALDRPPDKQRF